MVATLTFNLDEADQREAHMRCVKALDLTLALFDIQNKRKELEYFIENNRDPDDILEKIMEEINDTLAKYNINFEEILS